MSSWWAQDDTRDPKECRDEGLIIIIKQKVNETKKKRSKLKHKMTQPTQNSTGGYHRLGKEQGNTANKEQRLYHSRQ